MVTMKVLLLMALIALALTGWFTQAFEDEYYDFEVEADGTVTTNVPEVRGLTVSFQNGFENDTLVLYWLSKEGDQVTIGEIPPLSAIGIETFDSHVFAAKPKIDPKATVSPRVHTIFTDTAAYYFGPPTTFLNKATGSTAPPAVEKPFYRVLNTVSTSVNAKFRNLVPTTIDVWYEDGRGGSSQGTLSLGMEYTVNTYEGHVFFFTEHGDKSRVLARHRVSKDKVLYVIDDSSRPPPEAMRKHQEAEEAFMAEYLARTGIQWRHYFGPEGPRGPPKLHMFDADEVGQVHSRTITEPYWTCVGPASDCHPALDAPFTLNLTVISTAPRAFLIEHFLSDAEVDVIIQTAAPRMAGSYVGSKEGGGARKSDTRTSRNAWVGREVNEVTQSLFRRAEQLLNIPKLDRRNAEDMQVVHYVQGQKYDAHHDWGVSGYAESRFLTLLLYLTDMESPFAGGETSFPKGAQGQGFKVHPGKGNAVLFYNLLPDGNGDDLALHAALPVGHGEKWLANFWVWDPSRR